MTREERDNLVNTCISKYQELKDRKDLSLIDKMKPLQFAYHLLFIDIQNKIREQLNKTNE